MAMTIEVSHEYYEWLTAHNRDGETMEKTLRRLIRGPHPNDVAGLLTHSEADTAKWVIDDLRDRDPNRP